MDWCEDNDVGYVFGLSKNETLDALVFAKADEVRTRRAIGNLDAVRDFTETRYAAKSWSRPRRVVARIEATRKGLDIRYVVTSIARCDPASLYSGIYCARGQAENLIKRHKSQLASDRTSCRSPLANQMRLILHTAAYWLMRSMQDAIPRQQPLAKRRVLHAFGCGCSRWRCGSGKPPSGQTGICCQLSGRRAVPRLGEHDDPAPKLIAGASAPMRSCRSTSSACQIGSERGPASRRESADIMLSTHNKNAIAGRYELDGLDTNTAVANLYEQRYRREGRLEFLEESDRAVKRIQANYRATREQQSEALSLIARNAKTQWRQDFESLPDVSERRKRATSRQLIEAYDAARRAYSGDLKSCLAALQICAIAINLAENEEEPESWADIFDSDTEAKNKLVEIRRVFNELTGALRLAIETTRNETPLKSMERKFADLCSAALLFLTSENHRRVCKAYNACLSLTQG